MQFPTDEDLYKGHEATSAEQPKQSDLASRFVALTKRERELQAQLDEIGKEKDAVGRLLVDDWTERCIQNMTVDGMRISLREDFYANKKADKDGVSKESVVAALEAVGLGDIVRPDYAPGTLKARVREFALTEVDGNEVYDLERIPEELRAVLNVGTIVKPVATRASR